MQISICLPDSYKEELQRIADKETFGNVTMLVRYALAAKHPALKGLKNATRKKRGNGKGRENE